MTRGSPTKVYLIGLRLAALFKINEEKRQRVTVTSTCCLSLSSLLQRPPQNIKCFCFVQSMLLKLQNNYSRFWLKFCYSNPLFV
jgi:hypothetical protein